MTLRTRPIQKPVQLLHDGELLNAEAGEPLAFSLIAAERLLLARSPKLHRPRGPFCLRGACDGCLVRVDGVPNVMACRTPVLGGETVETQNVVGSRELDLLAATDFMFPHGIDHHRLFAGVAGVSAVVQRAARRIAGLGRLPDAPTEVLPSQQRDVDVLIVGGGRSGLRMAAALGSKCLLIEESTSFGGARALLDPADAARAVADAKARGAELLSGTSALGVFGGRPFEVLLQGKQGLLLVHAERLVLANGGHDATPDCANGDLPGVFTARAALTLQRAGILPGRRVALVGAGDFTDALVRELAGRVVLRVESAAEVTGVVGTQRVRRLELGSERASPKLDAVVFDGSEAPAFELGVQAGGRTHFEAELGYVLERDAGGKLAENAFVVGRVSARADGSRSRFDDVVRSLG